MGTEKQLTELLMLQLQGGGMNNPVGLRLTGGTPNHKALARVVGYAWGLSHPADRDEARARVLEFLEDQKSNHMGFGLISEFGTSSHFAWWQNAMAGLWKLAEREGDEEVLEGVRGWWVRELSVEGLCATPRGKVVMPGARTHVVKGYADQRRQRDIGRAVILGADLNGGTTAARIPRDVRAGRPSLDRVGLWILHSQLPAAELRKVAEAPAEWPVLLDTLFVQRGPAGHVAWFDTFTGLCPSFYAWAEYGTGEERYGARGDWKKSQPGGARPADLPVPEVPGEVTETVVIPGRNELIFRGHGGSGASERRRSMDTKETQENAMKVNEVNVGIGFEPAQGLRRPPRKEVREIVEVHEPEEPLKSERVEEALQAIPDWHVTEEGESISCVKELPTITVASLYAAYVTGLAGTRGLPVAVSVNEGVVVVTLHGPCKVGLTETVLDVACQIG